ncbi:SpoIIE family protein phosphatase [Kitasatospora sp. NBC_01287]|uniref:SpoIIE family protein phosphatase n=1 Tax=Kitasatospora sp. NBC_01287 TaxID=2903573 RepID=UPI00225A6A01|nr:SpoIIE family protein phosphatase [Kitasatospora sp. NBC_01287]MCX4744957.1 SpoIIE family protein phosphatase [Kitasatospora sp. NBC_01287]
MADLPPSSPPDRTAAGASPAASPATPAEARPTAANDRLVLNGMGSFDWDLDTGTYHLDEVGLRVFDLRADEFDGLATSLTSRVPPEESAQLDETVTRALDGGELTFAAYFRLHCRDGTPRWAHTQGRVLRDAHGHPYRIVGIVRNAEEELAHAAGMRTLAADRRRQTDSVRITTDALARALTVRDVTAVLTDDEGLRRFGADGLALGLTDGGMLRLVAVTTQPSPALKALDDLSLTSLDDQLPLAEAVLSRRPRFIGSEEELIARYPRLLPYAEQMGIRAAAFLPLAAQARAIGALGLYYRDRRQFSTEDRNICIALASAVAQSLQRAMLFDQEREFATTLQTTMLPRRLPEISGGSVAVRYRAGRSGREVGGDWYDVVALPRRRVALIVGDVEGHDSHAAAVMGQLRIALRAYSAEGHIPSTVMARASRFLADLDTDRSATCVYAEADLETGTLRLVRAGHLEPLVRHGRHRVSGPSVRGGLPLGVATVFGQDEYPETRLDLNPGDTLLLCTDGLVEHRGQDISEGLDALARALGSGPVDPEELADHLSARLLGKTGADDDMAFLLLRRAAVPGESASRRMVQHIHQADPEGLVETRTMLRQALAAWGAVALSGDIELVTDELLTNALVHTDGGAILTVELLPAPALRIHLDVQDRSSAWPRRREPGETATSGRGLLLVDALATNWGVEPRGTGKSVWCEFPLPGSDGG